MTDAFIGTGTTVSFATSGFTANIMEVGLGSISRESVEDTHLGTTDARTFIPGKLYDSGEITLEIAHDPDVSPPISGPVELITIEWAKKDPASANGARWSAQGFVTGFEATAPLEDKMTGSITIKLSGALSFTQEA